MWKIWQTLFADISSSRYVLEMLEFFQSPFFYFFYCIILLSTHPRLDMEPETQLFERGSHLPNQTVCGFMLNLWGVFGLITHVRVIFFPTFITWSISNVNRVSFLERRFFLNQELNDLAESQEAALANVT